MGLDKLSKSGRGLLTILMLLSAVYLGTLTRNAMKEYQYIGRPDARRDTITISAEGRVTAIPDIATTTIGVQTEKPTVREAQEENTRKMNKIIARLKQLDIEEEDIKTTGYSVYPVYDYYKGKRTENGFRIDQRITVKIRDLDSAGDILAAATSLGANQVSGLNFTIDEPENLRQQARLEALEKAKKKAKALTKAAGVKLGNVVGFSEGSGPSPSPVYKTYALEAVEGDFATSPDIERGSQEIVVIVNVIYEIIP